MKYDVQIGNSIRRGISYAELVTLPIGPDSFVRRANGDWIQAKDCIELTHIVPRNSSTQADNYPPSYQDDADYYPQNELFEEEFDDIADSNTDSDDAGAQHFMSYPQTEPTPAVESFSFHYGDDDEEEEDRVFIPSAEYLKCKQKRRAAIIGVCTLGLAGLLLMGVGNTWRSNIFANTSLSANAGLGFVLKCVSFCLLTALIAIPYFVYSVFALIYYSLRMNNLNH